MGRDVQHDADERKFYVVIDGVEARLDYRRAGNGVLDYRSTLVPPGLRGEGVGQRLVLAALEHARECGLRVIPSCPFVRRVVENFPEFKELTGEDRGGRGRDAATG